MVGTQVWVCKARESSVEFQLRSKLYENIYNCMRELFDSNLTGWISSIKLDLFL